jgi:phosphatidylserine decarboxylase
MIAKDAWMFIIPGGLFTVLLIMLGARFNSYVLLATSMLFAVLTLFVTFFFRDPERTTPDEPLALISPADGTVLEIDSLPSFQHINGPAIKISIFLSVFNVHVNRTPASGVIDYVKYNPGEFFKAFEPKASEKNEQTEIGMTTASGHPVVFKQIAGIIARRIVCTLTEKEEVRAGERIGLIRFGSRMDLIFPQEGTVSVKIGDKVVGGETIMGYLPEPVTIEPSRQATVRDDDKL